MTYGTPQVTDTETFDDIPQATFFSLLGSVESASEHPLGKAIYNFCKDIPAFSLGTVNEFQSVAGRGVEATVENQSVVIGNRAFLSERNCIALPEPDLEDKMRALEMDGKTVMLVSIGGVLSGMVAVADKVRPEAAAVVKQLQRNGTEVWMVTG